MAAGALLFACALLAGVAVAQRVVTVQSGPLVRTEGSHVTIWCNVTGYKEGLEQDFEWSMYLPSAPDREIRIVSTAQPNYAYAVYAQRVNSKEIFVERLSRDSAVLHITKVQAKDQGLFECYTPNTDGRYLGSYSARTNLTVIADSLTVAAPAQTLSKVEGDTLQLTCEVSRTTLQHTHLSVGWYLRSPEDAAAPPQELVTLSRDFVLRSGGPYRQRITAGDLRLDKTSATAYRLTIHKLQPVDQGLLYCQAAEWIQDPDGSWFAMTRKQSDKAQLRIQPTDRDFSIQVSTERRSFTAGEPLELRCTIEAQNVPERFFSVSWVFSSSPVAVVGPSAVPVLGPDYVAREAAGHMTVRKESTNVHLLKLQHLRLEDAGKYICRVTEREKTPTGDFIDRSKRSRNVQITVQPLKSNITVSLSSNSSEVLEGDVIQLICSVQSTTGPLSVVWQWTDKQGTGAAQEVASVGRDGTIWTSPTYRERSSYGEIRVEKVREDTFSLSLYNSLPGDEGQYRCTATDWSQTDPELNWEKMGEKSATKTVTVKTVESSFMVSASSRTPSVTFGDSFDLLCLVKPRHNPRVPTSVTWRFMPAGTETDDEDQGEFKDLVTFTREGTLQWGEQLLGLGTRTTVDRSHSNTNFRLSVTRAGRREAGKYQCTAILWRRNYNNSWSRVANRTSNLLGISVLQPESKLRVQKTNQSQVYPEDSRVRINCSITSQTSQDSQHAVLWYVRRATGSEADELLLRIERSGAFEYGAYADEERLRRRVQAERLSPRSYVLTLNRAESSDSGTYYCLVEEWLSDPDGAWYRLSRESSGFTEVLVRQPEVRLQVEEMESNVTVAESGSIRLGCSIPSQSSRDSRFSVSWYVEHYEDEDSEDQPGEEEREGECVFSIGHDAVFGNGNCSPREEAGPTSRLQFERMASDQYSLTIQGARPTDAGRYYCHVEEWLLNPRNAWYRLATNNSGFTIVNVLQQVSTLQSVVCSNDSLFYFVFFYPFPIFGILLIAVLLVRYKSRNNSKSQEGKNGAPLLWIKEPHLSYSPTCLDPPALSLHPGSVD
ncbi:immunoglobulin superfamily member 3 [Seriola lalandi dorsalis]|uniref:Immunoglobulin superfamily member 3 n=1 Tax=Seriola lalandi dorsalis TaxID=1841481 RepID=A0A3B4YAP2_SERLL|nr:immunoglobulin superfamily member 3 [Seriola lalandi dorsalis]XP_023271630.1 immunoglobulin superfamily member 3 [Seriola lalandi dorsalis]XP_056244431.1 immunoglobulin superfamily member 3 [Seriola aureovittata]XP_056244432.1 immunoglobulin superfamily member 3 [Seriola aureovittata]